MIDLTRVAAEMIFAALVTVKDWADLIHALAWPAVVLTAILLFRKSLNDALADILKRIPWERTTSVKAKVAELKIARDVKIPIPDAPRPAEADEEPLQSEAN